MPIQFTKCTHYKPLFLFSLLVCERSLSSNRSIVIVCRIFYPMRVKAIVFISVTSPPVWCHIPDSNTMKKEVKYSKWWKASRTHQSIWILGFTVKTSYHTHSFRFLYLTYVDIASWSKNTHVNVLNCLYVLYQTCYYSCVQICNWTVLNSFFSC